MAGKKLYSQGDYKREVEPEIRRSTGAEPFRNPYRRDFARLIHSPAFRRLQGKTQVFPGDESDFFRNRLTHSLEVAQVAKSIAIRLNANDPYFKRQPIDVDLVEFAGMAHDLGHPPFGHNGEAALDVCMADHGGFEGNAQTFRILTKLEKKEYPKSSNREVVDPKGKDARIGLNLAYRSLAAILKYDRVIPKSRRKPVSLVKGIYHSEEDLYRRVKAIVAPNFDGPEFKTVECCIMDVADDIAYSTYDLEDTFKAGFFSPLKILSHRGKLWERVARKVGKNIDRPVSTDEVQKVFTDMFGNIQTSAAKMANRRGVSGATRNHLMIMASNMLSEHYVVDGYTRTQFTAGLVSEFLSGVRVKINKDYPQLSKVFLDEQTLFKVETLKHFTFEATIMSPRMRVYEHRGFDIVTKMFEALNTEKGFYLMPDDFRDVYSSFKDELDRRRVICDFIAGMTDRYAVEFYGRLFSESPQSIFKPF